MSDIKIIATFIKARLSEIGHQATVLGTGLQNAAPGEKNGVPNNSVQYLLNIGEAFAKNAAQCEAVMGIQKTTEPKP